MFFDSDNPSANYRPRNQTTRALRFAAVLDAPVAAVLDV
jgi:hypothetical protein